MLCDADGRARFHYERYRERDLRAAKGFIVFGIVRAVSISPFLVHRALNG